MPTREASENLRAADQAASTSASGPPAILVEHLTKAFRVPAPRGERSPGLAPRLRALLRPAVREVRAVRGVSFRVAPGERVAFLGPNGAGKSTMLKMLTGILHPTSGRAEVAGLVPWERRRVLALRVGIVFGQRSQLWYRLPVRDSLDLLARIYGVERRVYADRCRRLSGRFEVRDLLDRPVAQLSLGQRMRCEVVAALLHAPEILLLDEPTIGLDVVAKAALREHLNAAAREDGTTVLLTSHDAGDVEEVCERAIVIDRGELLLDRPVARLRRDVLRRRVVSLVTEQEHPTCPDLPGVTLIGRAPHRLTLAVDGAVTPVERLVALVLERLAVRDLTVEAPPMEEVIRAIYRGEEAGRDAPR